jgi:adenylosuccinate lyase
MVAIWSPETRFRIWFEIEAMPATPRPRWRDPQGERRGASWRAKDATFDVARIDEIEAVTKHDVIAFLTHLGEIVGVEEARFVHQGMTSSDVLDTCLSVQLCRAADLLMAGLDRVCSALRARAYEHKLTPGIGAATASKPSPPRWA